MIWSRLLPSRTNTAAAASYRAIVSQARQPAFYAAYGVPDSVDGRFEMIALHMFAVLHRLKPEPAAAGFSQDLFDIMFADMDRSLREMGVGDLGVGRRIKAMAQGLYGRMAAYEAGLAAGDDELAAALRRNVYGTVDDAAVAAALLPSLCGYVRALVRHMAGETAEQLMAGHVTFPAVPVPGNPVEIPGPGTNGPV